MVSSRNLLMGPRRRVLVKKRGLAEFALPIWQTFARPAKLPSVKGLGLGVPFRNCASVLLKETDCAT